MPLPSILPSVNLAKPVLNAQKNIVGFSAPGSSVVTSGNGYYPSANTYAAILAAYNAAVASGGGTIFLGPFTYNIGGNSLPISSKIKYQGAGWLTSTPSIPDSGYATVVSGTIINGNGTAAGIIYNTDLGGPVATQAVFSALGGCDMGVDGIAFTNCSFGMKIGGAYNAGAFYSSFTNCIAQGCGWGFWFENAIHNLYDRLYAIGCTVGQMQFRSSCTSAILQPANCRIGEIMGSVSGASGQAALLIRGIEVTSKNGTYGGLSNASIIQSNRFNNPVFTPVSAICDGSTGNITVPASSSFAVDLPIAFTASGATNLSVGIVYFVTSIVDSTHITIAKTVAGTTLIPTAGTATLTTQGFAPLAVVAYNIAGGDFAALGEVGELDLEAGGTAKLLLQSATAGQNIGMSNSSADAFSTVSVCIRGTPYTNFYGGANHTYDSDTPNGVVYGSVGSFPSVALNFLGKDQASGNSAINIAQNLGGERAFTLYNRQPGNADWTYPGRPIGVKQFYMPNSQTFNAGNAQCGFCTFTGTTASTITLNNYIVQAGNANSQMQGFRQVFKNNGTATVTITLGSFDGTFDGMTGGTSSGKSIILTAPTTTVAGGSLVIVCSQLTGNPLDKNANYQWSIESMMNATLV